ncbi:flagellar basal body P-ring formation chaperone FlgA [Paracoccus aestuariivivens]|uniref:Flagella basal body P-ring formation protein FlgA n=1 Tax=Paracoccus aestuariivivens TaxID=1820333 RepID=A0A6L6JGA7_9RHOB|nr:flagellar basal body P-ring formation chaperone FlgA [Paracoccus aestuariivivens]MTH78911.1 flagellar basal body P-ring formation protein FlgA [Paracoccus aestuariivivens]
MIRFFLAASLLCPISVQADALVAARTLRSGIVLSPEDIRIDPLANGNLSDPESIVGMELRVMISAGRPIERSYLAAPRIIVRNQTVTIAFERDALRIETEGRALSAGSVGEVIRVMNNASRTTLSGHIAADGTVVVSPN